ncbi:hypothetical protein V1264_013351 [Littorina saxatilis]|uniref:Ig-like domain-containing protein n=2 Tax=Littorina saxatilis TaxID=31220 RepID=A0AAN9BQD7_9CAEN
MSTPFTTCTVDPVVIGGPAVVICSFEDDMQMDKLPIVAYHTKINSTEKDKIANCFWSKEDIDYKCQHQKGLLLKWEVSHKLRLTIEQVDEDAQGDYICQKSPSKPSESRGCRLTLLDTPVVSTSANTFPNGTTANGNADSLPAVYVAAIAVSVSVLVGGVIAALLLVCRRRNKKAANAPPDNLATTEASTALV